MNSSNFLFEFFERYCSILLLFSLLPNFWKQLFHFLTFRIIFCSYLRWGYHMYLFYVKVKLITKQTYYVSGVRLYNKSKILVVHYVIWLLPCKGVWGILGTLKRPHEYHYELQSRFQFPAKLFRRAQQCPPGMQKTGIHPGK